MSGPQTRSVRFGRFVLDPERGCVLLDGVEVPLRPKTFAVLQYLVAHPGRLISKDELMAAVWQNSVVTDDALVQSVGELRRALGDEGPQLIKTVPRRGYRFDAELFGVDAPGSTSPAMPPRAAEAARIEDAAHEPGARPKAKPRAALYFAGALAVVIGAWAAWAAFIADRAPSTNAESSSASLASTAEAHAKPAIAVLPFRNQGGDPTREYFADGLTQDIINALGRFSSLTVMSWNAVLPFKNAPTNPAGIARNMDVRYQIEGSVQQTSDRVRVTAQLVDAEGRVLWSARFDEALGNLFELQDNLTAQIAAQLAIRVTQFEQRRVLAKPPENLEAHDYVLRARPALRQPTRANNAEARVMLRRAVEIDPGYAAAYSALGETYHIAAAMGWAESPAASLSRAEEMARKALDLDDSDLRARILLGRIHLFHYRYDDAKAQMERAIAINPNDADGLAGRGHILLWLGQTDAAIETLELAQRIDPDLNVLDRFALALAYYVKGRYDDAIGQAEQNIRRTDDAAFNQIVLAAAYAQRNRREDAARLATLVRSTDPTFDPETFGNKFLKPGDVERLREGLRKANLYASETGAAE
jgi:adenylate cyclase